MLLIKKTFFEPIRRGGKTMTLRFWRRPMVRPGSIQNVRGLGRLRIDDVNVVTLKSLTADDAKADGFSSLAELKRTLAGMYPRSKRDGRKLFRVRFTYLPGATGSAMGVARENVAPVPMRSLIPVINKVTAGYPKDFTDLDYPPSVADEYVHCPEVRDPQAFAARVIGDSMEPAYQEGDVVVFCPNTPARSGDDCFVRFADHGGTTFKRFYERDERTIRLQPLNDKYPSETHPRESISGLWPAIYRIQRLR